MNIYLFKAKYSFIQWEFYLEALTHNTELKRKKAELLWFLFSRPPQDFRNHWPGGLIMPLPEREFYSRQRKFSQMCTGSIQETGSFISYIFWGLWMKASGQIELEFYLFAVLSLPCSALFFRCPCYWLPARFGPKDAVAGDWRTGENVIQNISTFLCVGWCLWQTYVFSLLSELACWGVQIPLTLVTPLTSVLPALLWRQLLPMLCSNVYVALSPPPVVFLTTSWLTVLCWDYIMRTLKRMLRSLHLMP